MTALAKEKSTPRKRSSNATTKKAAMTAAEARKRRSRIAVVVRPDVVNPVSGFVTFLREHAIVGLAVGLVIGTQVKALVDQLIDSFVSPIVAFLIGGGGSLTTQVVKFHIDQKDLVLKWGAFAYALIDFVAVLATIYAMIKIFNLDQLDKKKES